MIETDFWPVAGSRHNATSCLRRSINDYCNNQDVEAALRESLRRSKLPKARSLRDVFWRMPAINSGPHHHQDAIDEEIRRLESLKSFQILEGYSATPSHQHNNISLACPSSSPQVASDASTPKAGNEAAVNDDDLGSTVSTLNRLVSLATSMFDVPIALVSLTDLGQQNILAAQGLGCEVAELPLGLPRQKSSPCAHAVLSKDDQILVVPDIKEDARFDLQDFDDDNEEEETRIPETLRNQRFYAGAPLLSPEGENIGVFCILDTRPRNEGLDDRQEEDLRHLAGLAMNALVERRTRSTLRHDLQEANRAASATIHDLLTPLTAVELAVSLLREDQDFQNKLSHRQKESVKIASNCVGVLAKMCRRMRDQHSNSFKQQQAHCCSSASHDSFQPPQEVPHDSGCVQLANADLGLTADSFRIMYGSGYLNGVEDPDKADAATPTLPLSTVVVKDLAKSIHMSVDAVHNTIPVKIELHGSVPSKILTDDVKVLRCAMNLLRHCSSLANDPSGSIRFSIRPQHCRCGKSMLLFYCCQEQPDVGTEGANVDSPRTCECCTEQVTSEETKLDSSNDCCHRRCAMERQGFKRCSEVDLYSIAMQVESLGGDCGIDDQGAHMKTNDSSDSSALAKKGYWFRIPLAEPESTEHIELEATNASQSSTCSSDNTVEQPAQLCEKPQASTSESTGTALVLEAQPRKRRALIIEDSIVIRKVIANALSKIGFETETAVNGMEGLHQMQNSMYDVVLCDLLMPVMDGLDCVKQFRQWEKIHRPLLKQYIIGMSAHASEQDVKRVLQGGMDCYKDKPLTYKGLKSLVGACGQNQQQQQNLGSNAMNAQDQNEPKILNGDKVSVDGSKAPEYPRLQQKMCLIAAKNADASHDLARLTEAKGWRSLVLNCGADALEALKKRNWDAVFLEERLPLLSGKSCAAEFREWEKENRINQQTHLYIMSDKAKAIPPGANGILNQPVNPREFEALLTKAGVFPSLSIIMR
ncbi:Peroxide stress-activated histidine kinase [Seminavis robusta]|uniref:Peroxide stress-activated histidine kinase n=1 Tax=Seminavis robusta TaxID=568900 RepID=A0A9N8HJF7_9STRA|nr:Peroxide stress-activated histidine kinase [Seminavis robusta]|eukprot:Sro690_g187680.1 Peroxide stress-activated histidine kinase (987) ;mRNA; f:37479-40439